MRDMQELGRGVYARIRELEYNERKSRKKNARRWQKARKAYRSDLNSISR